MTQKQKDEKETELRRDYAALEHNYLEEKAKYEAIPEDRRSPEDPLNPGHSKQMHPRHKYYNERVMPAYQALLNKSIELNRCLCAKPEEEKPAE